MKKKLIFLVMLIVVTSSYAFNLDPCRSILTPEQRLDGGGVIKIKNTTANNGGAVQAKVVAICANGTKVTVGQLPTIFPKTQEISTDGLEKLIITPLVVNRIDKEVPSEYFTNDQICRLQRITKPVMYKHDKSLLKRVDSYLKCI